MNEIDNEELPPPPEWDRLLSACQKNDTNLIRKLLEKEGVSPSHANRVGQSALHIASLWGHDKCVEILLQSGANIHAANQITGATPLHCAIQSSKASPELRRQVVQLLLNHGANASMGDFYGSTPYDYCDEEDLKQLLQPQIPEIFTAILENNLTQVETILNQDESAIASRHLSKTPLLLVVDRLCDPDQDVQKQVQLLQLLLNNGGQPNDSTTTDRKGCLAPPDVHDDEPPLLKVCLSLKEAHREANEVRQNFLQDAGRLLLDHGATVSPDNIVLLHDAARRGMISMVDFLLTFIDINAKGRQGMTPLQFAARSGKTDMVQHLLQNYNPDLLSADDRGQTALDAAKANNKEDIVALLEQKLVARP